VSSGFVNEKVIDGKKIALEIRQEVSKSVEEMAYKHSMKPGLAVILVGDDPASAVYVRNKERSAIEVGMKSKTFRLSSDSTEEDVLELIQALNVNEEYHGILVQLPLPGHIDENRVISKINYMKDVDGLHPINAGLLSGGNPRFVPATPAGIKEMLMRTGNNPSGKHVVVLGRSNIVGRPVSNLLSMKGDGGNATVTVCHSRSSNLVHFTKTADIVIAALGIPNYLGADMISEGAVIIDVGINRVESPERKRGYRLVGDVNFEEVIRKSSAITPVPGGVGPLTIAMLLSNTVQSARMFNHGG
jgi:methylenetetrahydrofolate dehydrogenase (NADP+)/methenyltetrahydrofolate cyclohydrolase